MEDSIKDQWIKEVSLDKEDYIEEIARDELNYSYADEKIYYFVPSN